MFKKIFCLLLAFTLTLTLLTSCRFSFRSDDITPGDLRTGKTQAPTAPVSFAPAEEAEVQNGEFNPVLTRRILFTPGADSPEAVESAALLTEIFTLSGISPNTVTAVTGDISAKQTGDVVLCADFSLAEEEYRLTVTPSNVTVAFNPASACNGLLYGFQQFVKLCLISESGSAPCGETTVKPETKERTLMLDCARKCWSPEWIENLIREMSWMGFNALELHLTEEQGIRADIWRDRNGNAVPDCNGNDFSFICGGTVVSWNTQYPEKTDAKYTRDDLIEIIGCAQKYHIDIIPSVDFPGHSANLAAKCREKLAEGISFSFGTRTFVSSGSEKIAADGSYSSTIDISEDFTRNLSFAVTQAYAAFFREYGCDRFSIAADEVSVDDGAWAVYAAENGGSTVFDGCIAYINALTALLREMGYTVRANNDYIFSEQSSVALDPGLQICCWNPTDSDYGSAQYLADSGRTVFNCSQSFCYYVLRCTGEGTDGRSESCTYWVFHHATAERIYSGCGGNCGVWDCRETGGWNPSKCWDFNSSVKPVITGDSLGGAYFYIWSDWAGWDTEDNIFYREDGYNLVVRMWSSIAKMWDWDKEESMSFEEYSRLVEKIKYAPSVVR